MRCWTAACPFLLKVEASWLKRPVEVRVTMKRPRLWGQILLAREYLKMGVAPGWQAKDKVEELAFVAEHGKAVSRLLAYTVCRDTCRGTWASG